MIPQGLCMRKTIRLARELGCIVEDVMAHGEIRFRHPSWPRGEIVHNQRKTATRRLVMLLRRLEKP